MGDAVSEAQTDFINACLENKLVLGLGAKGSGKSYLMLNFLRHAMDNNLFQRYILILPAFEFEQADSYKFINHMRKDIFVFTHYNEVITRDLIKNQMDPKKGKLKTLFVIDDSSAQNIFNIDNNLKHMITVLRHLNVCMWLICHSCSGILSPFIRMNTDILLLSKLTNNKLLETVYEEFMSLHPKYNGRTGIIAFRQDFIKLHKDKYQSFYINCRNGYMSDTCVNWFK